MGRLGYHTLVDEIAVRWSFGGCIKDDQAVHVSLFVPTVGPVFADQFADWVLLSNGLNPNSDPMRRHDQKQARRDPFMKHMGTDRVHARRLRWDEYEADARARDDRRPA